MVDNEIWEPCDKCGRDITHQPKFKMDDNWIVCVTCCYYERGEVKKEWEK